MRAPDTYTKYLGSTFVHRLTDPEFAVLRIGKDTWTKHQAATDLGIVQTMACGILSGICKKLGVSSTADLYRSTSPYTFAEHRCGVTTLYVMFAAFVAKGLDPDAWYAKGEDAAMVSFLSLKHRELEAARRTRDDEKRRKRSGQQRTHKQAADKFLRSSATP